MTISLRRLIEQEKPLVTPLAHDALTARLIARAGFRAIAVGGSGLLAARYGLPDIGLAALGEMVACFKRATEKGGTMKLLRPSGKA